MEKESASQNAPAETDTAGALRQAATEAAGVDPARLRALFLSLTQGVVYRDARGQFQAANPAAEQMLGLTLAQMQHGEVPSRWRVVDDTGAALPYERQPYVRALRTGKIQHDVEVGIESATAEASETRWLRVDAIPEYLPGQPEPTGVFTLFADVTREREAQEAQRSADERLRDSEAAYRATFAQAAVGMARVETTNGSPYLEVNDRLCAMLGYSREELLAKTVQEVTAPESLDAERMYAMRLLTGEADSQTREKQYIRKDGSRLWVNLTTSVVRDKSGNPLYFFSVIEEIEGRKRAEEALREAAIAQRRLIREMLYAMTEGRLFLCDRAEDLPDPLAIFGPEHTLLPAILKDLRQTVRGACAAAGLPDERTFDFVMGVSEAAMNAVVHAGGGISRVGIDKERGVVQVWVQDWGTGIATDTLHRATLEQGYSSRGTLGHGFFLMVKTCDRFYLLTGPDGTTLVMEQEKEPPLPDWLRNFELKPAAPTISGTR